jgi:hypothetical protein
MKDQMIQVNAENLLLQRAVSILQQPASFVN